MIKRIIFDLDNTLIDWEDNYWEDGIKFACKKLNINYNDKLKNDIINVIDNYEKTQEYFKIDIMQDLINKKLNSNYDTQFIKLILNYFEKCVPNKIDSKIIETLKYLQSKYELVVLTNWFEYQQKQRLKNANLYKYFKKVYGTETVKIKPNKEAFELARGNVLPNECVMIGDNFEIDIKGAINAGLEAIFYNRKNIDVSKKYKSIYKFEELKELL